MNHDEAKRILRAYRSTDESSEDPYFAEALEVARHDPELARWIEQETKFDLAVAAKFAQIPPPAYLREQIVTGGRNTNKDAQPPTRSRQLILFVAALVVIASSAYLWTRARPQRQLANWQRTALTTLDSILSGREKLDRLSPNSGELRAWLQEVRAPVPADLPAGLRPANSLGCKTIASGGKRISIICFHVGVGQIAHLVTVSRSELALPPPDRSPQFIRNGDWITASWSDAGQSFMLAMKGQESELRGLLSPGGKAGV